MNILGVSGSPRSGGNTDILLDRMLSGARSRGAHAGKIVLNDLDFVPCQGCGGCDRTGVCVVRDDMAAVYRKIEKADVVIVASPIFFCSITAQLKAMIDRFQPYWIRKYILKRSCPPQKKAGFFLSVAGSGRSEFFENASHIVKAFFATLDIVYSGSLFCPGLEKKDAVKKDKRLMVKAFKLGAKLVK